MWFVYNIVFAIGFTLMLPKFVARMVRRGGYRRDFMQRFGRYTPEVRQRLQERPRLWIHAVSVGEVFVACRIMEELRARRPETAFAITTTTSTGHTLMAERLHAHDVLIYFPADFPAITRRALDAIRPRALLLTESELWPNLIRLTHARGIPVLLVNGRISDASFRGYRRVRPLVSRMLQMVDAFLVQSETDRARLAGLGAPAARVTVTGTAKYDMTATGAVPGRAADWMASLGWPRAAPILVGGSTWPGEEDALLDAYVALRKTHADLRLALVPRHAERGGELAQAIAARKLACAQRSGGAVAGGGVPDVALVDTTGELLDFYAAATVVFVGKSLGANHGGQNIIEPGALGKPVITGPNLENFPDVAEDFRAAGVLVPVHDAGELRGAIDALLRDPAAREERGRRAGALVLAKRGAVRSTAEQVERVLDAARGSAA